jgi:uncharacterized protein (TIGR02596 family)
LVELLTVIAIISALAAATLPALRGTMEGLNISGAAEVAAAEMSLARQTAVSRNLPVEVRIYKLKDGADEVWRAMAVVVTRSASGRENDEWITPGRVLPGNVIFSDAQDYSTMITENGQGDGLPVSGRESVEPGTPKMLRQQEYVSFTFRPDGSTTLASSMPWSLTLKSPNGRPAEGRPAANFIAIVLDAMTGRTMMFQP